MPMTRRIFFGSLALALILFDGGLGTRLRRLRSVLRPSLSLATLGVIITAGITAVAAKYLFGLGWIEAALMGAIVSSTDAAAVLMLIAGRDLNARPRVATTLEAESGFNDPMAVILVVTFVAWLTGQGAPDPFLATISISWAIVAGGLIGWFGGRTIAYIERKIGLPIGLYPIFCVGGRGFPLCVCRSDRRFRFSGGLSGRRINGVRAQAPGCGGNRALFLTGWPGLPRSVSS